MQPAKLFTSSQQISIVFTDIDDTLTTNGKLKADAYQALWDLHSEGVQVVPVTGRPAGWCEMIARLWPVSAVIGENGGFYFKLTQSETKIHQTQMRRVYAVPESELKQAQVRLQHIRDEVLKQVPRAQVASDQFARVLDLAIDFAEDISPALSPQEVDQIVQCFEAAGATAKVSSIHVNGWFGSYDKLAMTKVFCEKELGCTFDSLAQSAVFAGDSPNDEPMFKAFPLSFAVANISVYLKTLNHKPKYVSEHEGGKGFVEIASVILQHNRGRRKSS